MSAAERQLLQDRVDQIAALVRELEKDDHACRCVVASNAFGDAIQYLENASHALIQGRMKLDSMARAARPETPPMDRTVLK